MSLTKDFSKLKGGQVQKDSQQKQRPSVVAGSSNDMECQEERLDH